MTHDEAELRREELALADPSQTWLLREHDGDWQVVRVDLPGQKRPELIATTEAAPDPGPEDPRPWGEKLIPPFGPFMG
jgi:hypothetical protein